MRLPFPLLMNLSRCITDNFIMKIVGSIQPRMNSTRLPGKTLRMVAGKPLLGWQISRLQRSRLLDEIIVATSTSSDDDVLEQFCDQNEIRCFRGSENDVLGRIAGAIEAYEQLSQKYDTYILSSAPWDNPSAWSDKLVWVKKYFTSNTVLNFPRHSVKQTKCT